MTSTMKNGQVHSTETLIAGKSFQDFTPTEFHAHVTAMFGSRKRSKPRTEHAPGISLSTSKTGKITIRRAKAKRPIAYVTRTEIQALSTGHGISIAELWTLFREREFLIVETRMEAERRYAELRGIPF